jgi:hypothetical protein
MTRYAVIPKDIAEEWAELAVKFAKFVRDRKPWDFSDPWGMNTWYDLRHQIFIHYGDYKCFCLTGWSNPPDSGWTECMDNCCAKFNEFGIKVNNAIGWYCTEYANGNIYSQVKCDSIYKECQKDIPKALDAMRNCEVGSSAPPNGNGGGNGDTGEVPPTVTQSLMAMLPGVISVMVVVMVMSQLLK